MFHIFGFAAIAVAGGAAGYWLRGKALEPKPPSGVKGKGTQDQLSQTISDRSETTPPEVAKD